MKLLIVDDEKHVITAVRCLVPAKQLGITEILSAQTAAEAKVLLEKERPEIAVVDIILQNQTGMNLMAFIANHHLPTQVIAISGHSDYEYVRTMLLNGAVDYLLKPVEGKALVASIQKAIQRLHPTQEAAAAERAVPAQLSTQYIRSRLRKMLSQEPDEDGQPGIFPADMRDCTLLYYDIDYLPVCRTDFRQKLSSFAEKTHSYLSLHTCGYLVDQFASQHEYLIVLLEDARRVHLRHVENTVAEVFGATAFPFHMGAAENVHLPGGFPQGYRQARAAFFAGNCFVPPETLQFYPRAPEDTARSSAPGDAEKERRLLSLLIIQDQQTLLSEAEQWLNSVWNRDFVSLDTVRQMIDLYHGMYARWTQQLKEIYPNFTDDPGAERIRYADFVDEYFSFSAPMMTAGILRSLRRFSEQVGRHSTEDDIFKRIAFYMEINYDQPFDQSTYARMFHLNRDYLSRKFKQIYGEGMVSYLNRLRITQAERLMHDPQLKIRAIAYMTGFGDEKYFTRQFKEYYHITPSEYRSILQIRQP